MNQPLDEARDTVLWVALANMLAELTATGEITVNTAPAYVISHLCRELRAKNLVTEAGLRRRPGAS